MIAHRGRVEPLPDAGLEPLGPHQPHDPLATDRDALLEEILEHPGAPVGAAVALVRRSDQHAQLAIPHRMRRLGPLLPGIEAARGDPEGPTALGDGVFGPLRRDPGKLYAWCFREEGRGFS